MRGEHVSGERVSRPVRPEGATSDRSRSPAVGAGGPVIHTDCHMHWSGAGLVPVQPRKR